ncbi:unnamed protein product [Cladocopium goreaui]|uniref:Bacterial surface antigen (D15) domain-containing protein n=1 Tax=Cladocopium goreaui TaxID=2562237 RepID=A0A9P1DSV3_9DINO|nr:unnamed protein product [Cladocopium goreaui]
MPPQSYIAADTPVNDVRVFVDGLHGQTRQAALEAAQRLRSATTLGRLNAELIEVSERLPGAAVDVGPGANKGSVSVTFRPEHGCHLVANAGNEGLPGLNSAFSLRVDGTPAAEGEGPPPLRVSAEGRCCLEEEAMRCSLTASPTKHSWPVMPSLQLGVGMAGLMTHPLRTESSGHLIFTDVLGRHTLKLSAASRDLRPKEGSAFLKLPLQSSKTSVSYHFLKDSSASSQPQRLAACLELAGLLGDVTLGRFEACWMRQGPLLGGRWQLRGELGVAKALGGSTLPLEERFFLGGASGGLQRFLGFAAHGLGPASFEQRESKARFGLVKGLGGLNAIRSGSVMERTGPGSFLGGDTRASVEAVLSFPLGPMQLMSFGTLGLLVNRSCLKSMDDLSQNFRASLGAGVGYPLPGGGHLAATFSLPIQAVEGDALRPFQVSVSFGNQL